VLTTRLKVLSFRFRDLALERIPINSGAFSKVLMGQASPILNLTSRSTSRIHDLFRVACNVWPRRE
jgi:hypothetical protein